MKTRKKQNNVKNEVSRRMCKRPKKQKKNGTNKMKKTAFWLYLLTHELVAWIREIYNILRSCLGSTTKPPVYENKYCLHSLKYLRVFLLFINDL